MFAITRVTSLRGALPLILAADRFALAFDGPPEQDRPVVWGSATAAPECVLEVLAAVGIYANRGSTPGRGNTEGTPTRACASTRGHSFCGESFGFRGFRARRVPRLPARSSSELNGKEGVDGSSPSEGSQKFLLISPFWHSWQRGFRTRRPPSVHRPPRVASAGPGNRVAVRLWGLPGRRPPSVHGPFERECVE